MIFQASISYFSIPSKDLDTDKYQLYLYIGTKVLCYAIVDENNTIIAFEKYGLETITDKVISDFLHTKNWLTQTYQNIKIAFGNHHTTMVPEKYFSAEKVDKILALQYGDSFQVKNFSDYNQQEQLYLLYSEPREKIRSVLYNFPLATCYHYQSLLLQYCLNKKNKGNNLFVHFLEDVLVLVFLKDTEVLFSKTYNYISSEDTVYQILSVCRLLEISVTEVSVLLSGWLNKDAMLYNTLYKYIANLSFDQSENNLQIKNAEFDAHYFTIFEVLQQTN